MHNKIMKQRNELQQKLIGETIPRLWCPPITHYKSDGSLDGARQKAHWRKMVRHVGGFLVPGSTSDGWEMAKDETDALLTQTLDLSADLDTRILVGVLRTEVPTMLAAITRTLDKLKARTGQSDPLAAMAQARVCGFTVCPPTGDALTQAHLKAGLSAVLDVGMPVALYQLPQVTQNEMAPDLVAGLANEYANFVLFKDTSGEDRVALAGGGQSGVFLMRGAEGDYTQWLRESGGPYHGLLLSTANSFPAQLGKMVALLETGKLAAAHTLSAKLTTVVNTVLALVADIPYGNAFTNINKAIDHWMAYGPRADNITPPMLHAGVPLPETVIQQTGAVLTNMDWLPEQGYL